MFVAHWQAPAEIKRSFKRSSVRSEAEPYLENFVHQVQVFPLVGSQTEIGISLVFEGRDFVTVIGKLNKTSDRLRGVHRGLDCDLTK